MNGFFTLTWSNIKSAVVYGLLSIVLTFMLVVGQSLLDAGTIYGLDWAAILDKGVISVVGVLVTLVSLIKNMLTNAQGKFLGVVEVIPDKTIAQKQD